MTASRVAILAMLLGSVGAWTVVAQSSPHQKMLDALRQVTNRFLTRMYARFEVAEGPPGSGRDSGCSSWRCGIHTPCG